MTNAENCDINVSKGVSSLKHIETSAQKMNILKVKRRVVDYIHKYAKEWEIIAIARHWDIKID